MALFDLFDSLVETFEEWFENGYLWIAVFVAIGVLIYLLLRSLI